MSGLARRVTPTDQKDTQVSPPPAQMAAMWKAPEDTVKNATPLAMPPPRGTQGAGARSAALIFKVATAALVVLALTLAGLYAWNALKQKVKEVYVPPTNAPLVALARLHELELPPEARNPAQSAQLEAQGDLALHSGSVEQALQKYLSAWQANPTPELALRIGELYFQKDMPSDARNWWARYRKDAPAGASLPYIDARLTQ